MTVDVLVIICIAVIVLALAYDLHLAFKLAHGAHYDKTDSGSETHGKLPSAWFGLRSIHPSRRDDW